jgi:hypothetical protein
MSRDNFRTWLIVVIAILSFLIILYRLQTTRPATPDGINTPDIATLTPVEPVTPITAAEEGSCKRPYPDTSIWNVPLDWSIAKIHPMNDLMMSAFFKSHNWIGTDTSQYTPNLYWTSRDTPLVPVQLVKNRFRDAMNDRTLQLGQPAGVVWLPLPVDARPAEGTDGQLVVINADTGEEWGLNKGFVDGEGNWFAGGIYRYHIENSGIPPEGFGQRGAGIGQLAGIVRRCEVERGRIDHAVTIAYNFPCKAETCKLNGWPSYISPFRKTDGRGASQYDIPEGARLAIRPEISQQEITKACAGVKGCIVWALNMQEYGGFIVDNSDHPKTYAEGDASANWDPSVWSRNMLRDIPSDWYVVIDWNHPSTKVQ